MAPIGDDGHPIEIHHSPDGLEEMTQTDHRLGDNFAKTIPKEEVLSPLTEATLESSGRRIGMIGFRGNDERWLLD